MIKKIEQVTTVYYMIPNSGQKTTMPIVAFGWIHKNLSI